MGKAAKTSDRKELLKIYLEQYFRARKGRQILEARLRRMQRDVLMPPGLGTWKSAEDDAGEAASVLIRMDEIEKRIQEQSDNMVQIALDIMAVFDFLSPGSLEREIAELRHLDCLSWKAIQAQECLSRTACYNWYNKALSSLLSFDKINQTLDAFKEEREKRDAARPEAIQGEACKKIKSGLK